MHEVYLFRLEANPPAYLWSGVGDIVVQGDALAPTTTYRGIGTLTGLPELPHLISGAAERANFTLSGVDAIALKYTQEDRLAIRGATVRIGSLVLNDNQQPDGPVDWEWEGSADTVSFESQGQNGGRIRSITIGVGTATNQRSTAGLSFFTDADQRQRSPTDAFFSFIGGISQSTSRRFGPR